MKQPLRVKPYVRGVTFFFSYEMSRWMHRGYYNNATMLAQALFTHGLVESLAAFRRLCPDEHDWICAYRDIDVIAACSPDALIAASLAMQTISAYKEPTVLPIRWKSDAIVGTETSSWPGGEAVMHRMLAGIERRFAWIFAHHIFGLNEIAALCATLGAPLECAEGELTHPGAVMLELGNNPRSYILRTPFQLSVCPSMPDQAE